MRPGDGSAPHWPGRARPHRGRRRLSPLLEAGTPAAPLFLSLDLSVAWTVFAKKLVPGPGTLQLPCALGPPASVPAWLSHMVPPPMPSPPQDRGSQAPTSAGCFCPGTVRGTVHSKMKVGPAGRRGDIPAEVYRDGPRRSRACSPGGEPATLPPGCAACVAAKLLSCLSTLDAGPYRGPRLKPVLSHLEPQVHPTCPGKQFRGSPGKSPGWERIHLMELENGKYWGS